MEQLGGWIVQHGAGCDRREITPRDSVNSARLAGMPATGKSFAVPGVSVIGFGDDKAKREADYWDSDSMMRQLGPLPAAMAAGRLCIHQAAASSASDNAGLGGPRASMASNLSKSVPCYDGFEAQNKDMCTDELLVPGKA